MMSLPLVSVIIPLYNGKRYIQNALDSVFAQDYPSFEVIVIDDGSKDHSASLVKTYPNIHYIYQENQGNAQARNRGIQESKGEFCAFLDQDDLWLSHKLRTQISYFLEQPPLQYTIAHMITFLDEQSPSSLKIKNHFLEGSTPSYLPGTLVVRKTLFDRLGHFNPELRYGSDADFFFRAKDADIPFCICPEVLLYRRVHKSNLSHHIRASNQDLLKVIQASVNRKRKEPVHE